MVAIEFAPYHGHETIEQAAASVARRTSVDHDELYSEMLARTPRMLEKFEGRSQFKSYVWKVGYHIALDMRRKRTIPSLPENFDIEDRKAQTSEQIAMCSELEEAIAKAIDAMSPCKRQVWLDRIAHGLAYEEIAAKNNISVGTVKSRLHYVKRYLRRELRDYVLAA